MISFTLNSGIFHQFYHDFPIISKEKTTALMKISLQISKSLFMIDSNHQTSSQLE